MLAGIKMEKVSMAAVREGSVPGVAVGGGAVLVGAPVDVYVGDVIAVGDELVGPGLLPESADGSSPASG